MKKKCSRCQIEKDLSEFNKNKNNKDGYSYKCKICRSEDTKKYYEKNKTVLTEKRINFRKENPEKIKNYRKKEWDKHKEKMKELAIEYRKKNKDKINEYNKNYRNKNKISISSREKKYQNEKYKNDLIFKLKKSVRNRIFTFLSTKKIRKSCKTFEIVGCTPEELKDYLSSKFKDGMNWDNYGVCGWHIDHIIPLATAKDEYDIYKLCHYTNLQPLWSEENLKKGSKITTNINNIL